MLLKKITLTLLLSFIAVLSFCQADSKATEYINTYKELAIKEMQRTGVPASITLAQGILESQNGESDLAKRSNNHFGIKCKEDWTGDKVYHDDDARGECFRSYTSAEQSYSDHSDFLKSRPHYKFLFTLDPTDYEGWAKGLKKAGYATSSTYAQRLIDLIQRYNLQEYTLIALQRSKEVNQDIATIDNEPQSKSIEQVGTIVTTATLNPQDTAATVTPTVASYPSQGSASEKPVIIHAAVYDATTYPGGPFTINGTKVILAKEGSSLLALANEFAVSYKRLLEFNEMDETTDILGYDQLIFLAKKPKKGSKDLHIVEKNETLEIIAQKEGVQLEALLAYNRIPKGKQPEAGEKIYLKVNSPVTPKLVAAITTN